MSKELKTWIEDYFDWWSDGHEKFILSAEKMISAGMNEEEIKVILNDCHDAVSNEYQ
jgi:uncharacterized membrane-anchored protein